MRLGYNTNGFASHRLRDALEVIAGLGFRSVAITLDGGALDPYDGRTTAAAEDVGAWLRGRDLLPVVETGARFLLDPWRKHWPTLLSPDPAARERRADFLRRSIDVAVALGAPVVSLWSGTAEGDEPREVLDRRLAEGLSRLADYAAERGVVLGFEPEPGMHVEDMAGYERLRALVRHPALRLTLDVGHAHITEASVPATIERFAADTVNVHLEGMRRDRHDHLLPGEGDLDLAAAVVALRQSGYAGPANLELSRHSHMAVEAARRAAEFFRPLGLP
ncbi:MAG: sugar phosphate isomerase/epimerase family protein [Candidatus Binatia bacterium]